MSDDRSLRESPALSTLYTGGAFLLVIGALATTFFASVCLPAFRVLRYVMLPVAALLVCFRLWLRGRNGLTLDAVLLWSFMAFYPLSILINGIQAPISDTLPLLLFPFYFMLVAYFLCCLCTQKQRDQIVFWFLVLFSAAILILCLLGLYSFFADREIHAPSTWTGFVIGMNTWGRMQLFGHPNTAGIYCYLGLLALLVAAVMRKRRWFTVACCLAALVMIATLSITDSRSSRLLFAAGAALAGFALVSCALRGRIANGVAMHAVSILMACVIGVIAYLGVNAMFSGMNGIKAAIKEAKPAASDIANEADAAGTIASTASHTDDMAGRRYDGNVNFSLAGRDSLWKSSLQYLREHPRTLLFGRSPVEGDAILLEMGYSFGDPHNSLFYIVLRTGVISLAVFLWFAVRLLWRGLRLLLSASEAIAPYERLLPVFLFVLMAHAMAESLLPDLIHPATLMFFVMAGVVENICKQKLDASKRPPVLEG